VRRDFKKSQINTGRLEGWNRRGVSYSITNFCMFFFLSLLESELDKYSKKEQYIKVKKYRIESYSRTCGFYNSNGKKLVQI